MGLRVGGGTMPSVPIFSHLPRCVQSSKQEHTMIFRKTRVAAMMLTLAGLAIGGGSVATAGSSVGKCQPGRHEACVSVRGAAALSGLYPLERLLGGAAGQLVATAMRQTARPRIVVHPRLPYPAEEHGAIYGYAPGNYQLGPTGVLYGPYPLNPQAPIAELRY
jgi:hypothetical protein